MSETERLDFVQNFWHKRNWDDNDTQILETIMEDGSDLLWQSCAQAFLKHPDRERAVRFLIERLEKCDPGYEPLNYIQVLGLSKDPRTIPAIRPYFEKYSEQMEKEKLIGVPNDVVFGPVPYSQYFFVCEALLKITGAKEYDDAIRKYLDHENEQVRWWAEHSLGIEGPTAAKRTAEHWKGEGNSET